MYKLLGLITKILRFFPGFMLSFTGRLAGLGVFYLSGNKRGQALKNIKLLFPDAGYSRVKEIARESFKRFGMSVIESLLLNNKRGIYGSVTIEGREYFDSVSFDKGIFLGVHMGSWEVVNSFAAENMPFFIVVRRQRKKGLDRYLNRQRMKAGIGIVYEDDLKGLVDNLKAGKVLGIVFDHGTKNSNLYSEFLGKVVPVPVGALRIALKFRKKIYPVCSFRKGWGENFTKCYSPIEVERKEDFEKVSRVLNSRFEECLREHPYDYFWWYKRFKRSKSLNILVLSDNKAGHLKQSLSLSSLIKEKRPHSVVEVVSLSLSAAQRVVLDFSNIFSSHRCLGCFFCLRVILGKDFERVFKYADIVISSGSSLSSLNRILSYGLDAKSFIIQRGNVGIRKHDLAVVPFHDNAHLSRNIVRIYGSLSFPDIERQKIDSGKLRRMVKNLNDSLPKIGVFIGGPLEKVRNEKMILDRLSALKRELSGNSWQVLLSTSRRTPSFAEEFIEREFKDFGLLVIANKQNYPFVSGGMISLCDVVLVSSDSVSMVSESASVKPALIFNLFDTEAGRKHTAFAESLDKSGYAKLADIKDLGRYISDILDKKLLLKKLDNRKVVEQALENRL